MEFDELLVLKFRFPLAFQPYRLDKSFWKNFVSVFRTWNWNNHHLMHLWKVSPFLCFSMVTATCYFFFSYTTLQFKSILILLHVFNLLFGIFYSNIMISFRLKVAFVIQLILSGGLPKSLYIRLQAVFRIV